MNKTMEEFLQTPYWILDILPEQVPKDSPGSALLHLIKTLATGEGLFL